ncbi:MAG: hypothetical protein RLZZ50_578, partial [Verrucomicrobiota bacterium]
WHDGDYQVMPGALTRFNADGEDAGVSLQAGSVSKDTWIVTPGSQEKGPLPAPPSSASSRRGSATPSRLADSLYWLGRYMERTARLSSHLEKLDPLLRDENVSLDPDAASDAARLALELQDDFPPAGVPLHGLVTLARQVASDRRRPGSLVSNLLRLSRNLEVAKVRLPPEAWDIARRLRGLGAETASPQPAALRAQLATLESIVGDTLAHDTGWRFLEIGRRLERANQLLFLLRGLLARHGAAAPGEFRLQTALHFADSLFTYRAVFPGTFHPVDVLAWLVSDAENPRSLRFQAERLGEHLATLPSELAPRATEQLRNTAFRLLGAARLAESEPLDNVPARVGLFTGNQLSLTAGLHDRLSRLYFAHGDVEPGE